MAQRHQLRQRPYLVSVSPPSCNRSSHFQQGDVPRTPARETFLGGWELILQIQMDRFVD